MTYIQNKFKLNASKTCNITCATQETLMGTPAILPNSESGSPQISYTITSGMLPTHTGDTPASITYGGALVAGCINNGSSSRTLNYRVKKNGTSIATGSQSISAGYKGILQYYALNGNNKPSVGDVFEIYLWCSESATDMQLNRYALRIIPTIIKLVNDKNKLLANIMISTALDSSLTNFTQSMNITTFYPILPVSGNSDTVFAIMTASIEEMLTSENNSYGVVSNQLYSGSFITVTNTNSAYYLTARFFYTASISWSETNISYIQ